MSLYFIWHHLKWRILSNFIYNLNVLIAPRCWYSFLVSAAKIKATSTYANASIFYCVFFCVSFHPIAMGKFNLNKWNINALKVTIKWENYVKMSSWFKKNIQKRMSCIDVIKLEQQQRENNKVIVFHPVMALKYNNVDSLFNFGFGT